MMTLHKILIGALIIGGISGTALAGGYQLSEYSVTNLGRAFGGSGVVGDDYSAIAFNPAGMMLKKRGAQIGGNVVAIRAHADGELIGGPVGKGKLKTNAVLPHLFVQTPVGDRFRIGAGAYVPFGLGTYYKKNWFGATHALNSEINAIDAALAMAWQLTDSISVGASGFAEYVDARLTNATPAGTESDLNADGWAPGYTLGLMYRPQPNTRFGLTYRSKTVHDIKGPHYFHLGPITYTGDCGTKLVFPEHILLSAYHRTGSFGWSAMARWTRWSRFNKLNIHSDAYRQRFGTANMPTVNEDWRNVWMIGAGMDYYRDQHWTYRFGVAFDQGAVKRPANRTARVPDSDRWIASVGASYTTGPWQIDLGYAHMFWKHAWSDNVSGGTTLRAKYHVRTDLVGLSVQYHF